MVGGLGHSNLYFETFHHVSPRRLRNGKHENSTSPQLWRAGSAPLGRHTAPTPGSGELLIRVHAASVNAIDWKTRAGYLKDVFPLRRYRSIRLECSYRQGEERRLSGSLLGFSNRWRSPRQHGLVSTIHQIPGLGAVCLPRGALPARHSCGLVLFSCFPFRNLLGET